MDPFTDLKKKISDTLTFLHQERNDFLPDDDIIIPSRKDDHVSKEIDLSSSSIKKKRGVEFRTDGINDNDVRITAENEVLDVIKQAEDVVNDIKEKESDSIDKDDAAVKAQEVFKFLEEEASSPLNPDILFIQNEIRSSYNESPSPNKVSGIPVAKPRQKIETKLEKEKEKDIDLLFSEGERSLSPTDDFLSKIPVSGGKGKVKTIKKHSKDPLKEFVKLTQDVNWDDNDGNVITTVKTVTTDPIVKTTVTRITTTESETPFLESKSKIPVLNTATTEITEISPKSKIPVLVTETTRIVSPEATLVERTIVSPTSSQVIETNLVSPVSETKFSIKSSTTMDSDSDSDSRRSPPLKGILKKTQVRTVGSSSGSDIALHEEGSELSEDESGKT